MEFPITILEFRDTTGLDEPLFATFRLGGTLAKKLRPGDRVLIVTKGVAIGVAEVARVDAGPALPMLQAHAAHSHMELRSPAADAQALVQRRLESLRKLYGPARFNERRTLSVIYLTPSKVRDAP